MDLLDDAFLKDGVKDEMFIDHIDDVTAVSPRYTSFPRNLPHLRAFNIAASESHARAFRSRVVIVPRSPLAFFIYLTGNLVIEHCPREKKRMCVLFTRCPFYRKENVVWKVSLVLWHVDF